RGDRGRRRNRRNRRSSRSRTERHSYGQRYKPSAGGSSGAWQVTLRANERTRRPARRPPPHRGEPRRGPAHVVGRVSRRILTLIALFVPLVVLVVVGFTVHVPFVAMGPGPTFNTLGEVQVRGDDGEVVTRPVVDVSGPDVDETSGHLNMTTVAVRDELTLFDAIGLWADGGSGVVPREEVYAPGKSEEQIQRKNEKAFRGSEQNAQAAALNY